MCHLPHFVTMLDFSFVSALLAGAQEILIATRAALPTELWNGLVESRSTRVAFLIEKVFDADYLLKALDAGFHVYEAEQLRGEVLVVDRQHAFALPDWTPLDKPFELGCKLAWSRVGYYTRIRDTVTELMGSHLFRVRTHHSLVFSALHLTTLPRVGEPVTILANASFLDAATPLYDVVKIWSEPQDAWNAALSTE